MTNIINEMINKNKFTNHFQPIYQLHSKKIVGYESLFRSSYVASPETLFGLAHMTNQVYELDIASIKNSADLFHHYCSFINNGNLNLFVNVFPSTLTQASFTKFLNQLEQRYPSLPKKIVFEINEAENTNNIHYLRKITERLKNRGYRIALDDLGKGYSSLKMLLELEPDIMKLDKYFAFDLHKNEKKRDLLKFIVEYVENKIDIVLEGIEHTEDFHVAQQIGIKFGQGYLFGKPAPLLSKEGATK